MTCAMRRAAPAIIYAALAAAASFCALDHDWFQRLGRIGLILTVGVLLTLVATLTLLPRPGAGDQGATQYLEPLPKCQGPPSSFLSLSWNRPRPGGSRAAGPGGFGCISLLHVKFDLNPLHLQNQKTESGGLGDEAHEKLPLFHGLRRHNHEQPGRPQGQGRGPEETLHGVSRGVDSVVLP